VTAIDTRHGRIAYVVSGPGEGPACVLIHGWTALNRLLADFLAEHGGV
jgi:pimeloyl-ACP methyl ester carboxylesterase